jgi:Raf kinase inhibitor-like YbhB/YbcL family protein
VHKGDNVTSPYDNNFPAAPLTVSLPDVEDGTLGREAWSSDSGAGSSPAVSWGPVPEGTQSLLVTVFDNDAPVPGGFWHWVALVPAEASALVGGASGTGMPAGAVELTNSFGVQGYVGANPPAGTGTHRYFVAVTALSVPVAEVPPTPSTALLHAVIVPSTLARGYATATATAPAQ